MAEVRFRVTVNGRFVGTAGLDGSGFLNILLRASRIEDDPDPFHPGVLRLIEESELIVGGHDMARGDMHWAQLALAPGDVVAVQLLGPGPSDPPAEVYSPVGPDDLPF
jgi:hypothetical protein